MLPGPMPWAGWRDAAPALVALEKNASATKAAPSRGQALIASEYFVRHCGQVAIVRREAYFKTNARPAKSGQDDRLAREFS